MTLKLLPKDKRFRKYSELPQIQFEYNCIENIQQNASLKNQLTIKANFTDESKRLLSQQIDTSADIDSKKTCPEAVSGGILKENVF